MFLPGFRLAGLTADCFSILSSRYMVGLWLDTGSPPGRGSFFMQTAVFGGWQKLGLAYVQNFSHILI